MSNSGLFEAHKKEDCEAHTTRLMGAWLEKLTDRWVAHVQALIEKLRDEPMETRRYRDPREQDPNYGEDLRALEGDIRESEPRLRIDRYDEGGGEKDTSWQKWILGIVSLSLVGMLSWALGKLDTLNQEVATLQATQTMGFAAIAQRQTADEQRIDRVEARVYRGNP